MSDTWQKKALLALRFEVAPADIAFSVTLEDGFSSGRLSAVYEESASRFRELARVEPQLEEVARIAIAIKEEDRERWMRIETQEELYGS